MASEALPVDPLTVATTPAPTPAPTPQPRDNWTAAIADSGRWPSTPPTPPTQDEQLAVIRALCKDHLVRTIEQLSEMRKLVAATDRKIDTQFSSLTNQISVQSQREHSQLVQARLSEADVQAVREAARLTNRMLEEIAKGRGGLIIETFLACDRRLSSIWQRLWGPWKRWWEPPVVRMPAKHPCVRRVLSYSDEDDDSDDAIA